MSRHTQVVKRGPQSIVPADEKPTAAPACDIYESENEILVVADMPGVSTEAVNVRLENGELLLEGRRESSVESGSYVSVEYRDHDYRRRFTMPFGIDSDRIGAELRNGVLQVHLPKSQAHKPRRISIRAG